MLLFIVSAPEKALWCPFPSDLDRYIFRRMMDKTRSAKEEMDGMLILSRQSRHISFVIIIIRAFFPTFYLNLACKQLCLPPRKRYN